MKKLPTDDDESLVNFLKANRPEVPPVASDLEEKLLQAVESETSSRAKNFFPHDPAKCKGLWLVPPAIAVGVLFTIGSDSLRSSSLFRTSWATTTLTKSEIVSLEDFLEHNWNGFRLDNPNSINFHNDYTAWMQLGNSKPQNLTKSVHQKTARK